MHTGRLIGLTVLLASLTACGAETTLTYTVRTNLSDTGKIMEVFQASERVMTRRLPAADVKNTRVTVVPSGTGAATMTIVVPNVEGAAIAERILGEPFSLDIRVEGSTLSGTIKGTKNWLPTGVDASTLLWVTPIKSSSTEAIGVELQFSEKGRELLTKAFAGNAGKSVGIFVRDLLVSEMTINSDSVTDHIIISGIPSELVAQIFADDVNVGLHAIFTQTQ